MFGAGVATEPASALSFAKNDALPEVHPMTIIDIPRLGRENMVHAYRTFVGGSFLTESRIMHHRLIVSFGIAFAAMLPGAFAGEFRNLDFEQATVAPTPVGQCGWSVDPAMAFPGWTMGPSGTMQPNCTIYNDVTMGSVAEILVGPNYPSAICHASLQGSYFAILQGGSDESIGTPALIQTGLVPENARSINFLVGYYSSAARVSLDDVTIPLVDIGHGRLAGDVTAFAGQDAKLMFSNTSWYPVGMFSFDDIQFSPNPVPQPEPSSFLLAGIGALMLAVAKARAATVRRRHAAR
jgi:hypothetical protein